MNNFFIDQFGTFDYKHANSVLVSTLLMALNNMTKKWLFILVKDILKSLIQNQKLLLFNSLIKRRQILFITSAEQLNLNPENWN
jgi:hypothetical protein